MRSLCRIHHKPANFSARIRFHSSNDKHMKKSCESPVRHLRNEQAVIRRRIDSAESRANFFLTRRITKLIAQLRKLRNIFLRRAPHSNHKISQL